MQRVKFLLRCFSSNLREINYCDTVATVFLGAKPHVANHVIRVFTRRQETRRRSARGWMPAVWRYGVTLARTATWFRGLSFAHRFEIKLSAVPTERLVNKLEKGTADSSGNL